MPSPIHHSSQLDAAPCAFPGCGPAAAGVTLAARMAGQGPGVDLEWSLPAGLAGPSVTLLRYDVPAYGSSPGARPAVVGAFAGTAGLSHVADQLAGAPSNYLYVLLREGSVIASATPKSAAQQTPTYSLRLQAVSPNPARGRAGIFYAVPGVAGASGSPVSIRLFDAGGRLVRTLVSGTRVPGEYRADWHGESDGGTGAGSGVYFLRMESAGQVATRKLLWLR